MKRHNHFFWLDTENPQGGLCYADPKLTTDGVAPGVGINGGPILRYCGKVPRPGSEYTLCPAARRQLPRSTTRRWFAAATAIFSRSYEGREIDDSADIYPY